MFTPRRREVTARAASCAMLENVVAGEAQREIRHPPRHQADQHRHDIHVPGIGAPPDAEREAYARADRDGDDPIDVALDIHRRQESIAQLEIDETSRDAYRQIQNEKTNPFHHVSPLLPGLTAGMFLKCAGSLSASQAGTFIVASATSFTPTFALPPERSIRQAAATGLPPAARIASRQSSDDTPVEMISSTMSTGWFFSRWKLRRSWNLPSTRSTYIAGRPSWRPIS